MYVVDKNSYYCMKVISAMQYLYYGHSNDNTNFLLRHPNKNQNIL